LKYKLNINKPAPEEKEIEESKNFNRVLRQYRQKRKANSLHSSLLKINKQLPMLILIILMILVAFYFSKIIKRLDEKKNPIQQELKK
jgi:uncharacterized membrane protein (DUF106 family)